MYQLKSFADNGQGVSTIEHDEISLLVAALNGVHMKKYETVVFKPGILQSEGKGASQEDIIPLHVEYSDFREEAEARHDYILDEINAGTLVYSGVPSDRR